jgi:hypothetical protein
MAALSLLQGYSSHSESGSGSESEDDGIVVTIDHRALAGGGGAKRPPGRARTAAAPPLKVARETVRPREKVQEPVAAPAPLSTLDMPHYDLGQEGGREERGTVPLPRAIESMFLAEEAAEQEDPALHEGRLRSFAHCPNSWASYVYIELGELELGEARELLCSQLELEPIPAPHLSLSRVVSLRHHWLDPLAASLGHSLGQERRFHLGLDRLQVLQADTSVQRPVSRSTPGLCQR